MNVKQKFSVRNLINHYPDEDRLKIDVLSQVDITTLGTDMKIANKQLIPEGSTCTTRRH